MVFPGFSRASESFGSVLQLWCESLPSLLAKQHEVKVFGTVEPKPSNRMRPGPSRAPLLSLLWLLSGPAGGRWVSTTGKALGCLALCLLAGVSVGAPCDLGR